MFDGPSTPVVMLCADLDGSTRARQRLRDRHPEPLSRYGRLLRKAAQERGGREIAARGEQSLFAFRSARNAAACAVTAQRWLHRQAWPQDAAVQVRIGLDTGEFPATAGRVGLHEHPASGICAAGHGGQILASESTCVLLKEDAPADVTVRDLGLHRLRDLRRVERISQIMHPDLPAEFPPIRTLDILLNNLPAQLTRFIGREHEIIEVKRLLARTWLLTLAGPGGCGKTRLALQVAADVVDEYRDGAWLTELSALSDPALIAHAVASAIGVREPPGRSLAHALVEQLRSKSVLLVLDNCEHLVAACAEFAHDVLRACPGVRLLVTSREPLGMAGELTYRIPSLSLPPRPPGRSFEQVAEAEAVRLFVECAALSRPAFRLTQENADTVALTCQRLDGIPLAIELAAARVKSLSVRQIAERLDDRFRLLTRGNRAAPPRHRTLRAAIDWSYRLLSEDERSLLRRLAVFAGGWTLDAAAVVCGAPLVHQSEVMDLLAQLVEKSLVIAEERGAEPRYRMLETVREYAQAQLMESGEAITVAARHRDWYLRLAERASSDMRGPSQGVWLERLEAELDNLRAAFAWSMSQDDEAGTLLRLTTALYRFWFMRGRYAEGRKWLEDALERDRDAPPAMVFKALEAAAHFARQQRDIAGAVALLERGLALARERNDTEGTAIFLLGLGVVAEIQGDFQRGREFCERSLSLWRELGDKWQISNALRELGAIAYLLRDSERADAYHAESLELARELGDKYRMASALRGLADVALLQGDVQRATAYLTEGLTVSKETGNLLMIELCLEGLSEVASAEGRYDRAARLIGAAEGLREALGRHRSPTYQPIFEQSVAAARSGLGDAAFLAASEVGRAMPVADAIEYALTRPTENASRIAAKPKSRSSLLAPREREVAALVARGLTNRDIAAALLITERTAETHVQHILNKLGVSSRAQIAVWAAEQRLLQG